MKNYVNQKLQDTDLMPFGKYKGEVMQDVPASYLHYLWSNGLKNEVNTNAVAEYISRNVSALKQEYKNGIWT